MADVRALVGAAAPVDEELIAAAVRGWSHNTRRAFRSDLTIWGEWCRRQRINPASAEASDVARWWIGAQAPAYALVFSLEAALFVVSALLARRIAMPEAPPAAAPQALRDGAPSLERRA